MQNNGTFEMREILSFNIFLWIKLVILENIHLISISALRFISNLIENYSNFIPINIIWNILNEENQDPLPEEIDNDENRGKSETARETYESAEEL